MKVKEKIAFFEALIASRHDIFYFSTSEEPHFNSSNDEIDGINILKTKERKKASRLSSTIRDKIKLFQLEADLNPGEVSNDLELRLRNSPGSKLLNLKFVLEELLETEKNYLSDLLSALRIYGPFLKQKLGERTFAKLDKLFDLLEEIYLKSELFGKQLGLRIYNLDLLSESFLQNKSLFKLYPKYIKTRNESKAFLNQIQGILESIQKDIHDKQGLNSYLITPIQRLCRYELILKEIIKIATNENFLTSKLLSALKLIQNQANIANQIETIEKIKNCPFDIFDYSGPILYNNFTISTKTFQKKLVTFLFEHCLLLTERVGEEFQTRIRIDLNQASLDWCTGKKNYFDVKEFNARRVSAIYRFQAETKETAEEWIRKILILLTKQLTKAL